MHMLSSPASTVVGDTDEVAPDHNVQVAGIGVGPGSTGIAQAAAA